ncbi:MAG: Lcl C-terminal domain-containing protein [Planctomycetota bacterium]|jgi:hypothetical protein
MARKIINTKLTAILVVFIGCVIYGMLAKAGNLEPSAPPGPTMKTLDQIPPTWSQIIPAEQRFVLVLNDQAALDKETGLVWAKNANLANGTKDWENSVVYCSSLTVGTRMGWRLPTVEELASLAPLPAGHPFENVENLYYWSATTLVSDANLGWSINLLTGAASVGNKSFNYHVLPVRGGSGRTLTTHTP